MTETQDEGRKRDEFGDLFLDFSKLRSSDLSRLFSETYLERFLADLKRQKAAER
jgi:hypothetical protein